MDKSAATFGEKVIYFNSHLKFSGLLPEGIGIMNPFRENSCATPASTAFYKKYYNDNKKRHIILGINPGRFGAGITGVPFTDPKRLEECCHINVPGCPRAHEPSSLFVYEVIAAYGGERVFYDEWYINSLSPLGFVKKGKNGRETNYNYYDNASLQKAATPFIIKCIREQLAFGIHTCACICLGTGKNAAFFKALNREYGFFKKIIPLEHPRYVVQYKYGSRGDYVKKYVETLKEIENLPHL